MALRLPPPLQPGARIRLVAPAMTVNRERFEAGVRHLREAHFEPVHDDGVFAAHRYLAGSDAHRLGALLEALDDPDASAIWVARGGFGCTRLLPGLDVDRIREAYKWLIGFSDVTALHGAWHRAGLATLHGPNVSTLARWSEEARQATWTLLREPPAGALPGRLMRGEPGTVAPLVGGNLALLGAMTGTGHLPETKGRILLLEDVGEELYRLDRTLTQLRQAGVLDGVLGYVVGQLSWMDEDVPEGYAEDALEVVLDHLEGDGVPVLAYVPVGHETSSFPVPLGVNVKIDEEGLVLEA